MTVLYTRMKSAGMNLMVIRLIRLARIKATDLSRMPFFVISKNISVTTVQAMINVRHPISAWPPIDLTAEQIVEDSKLMFADGDATESPCQILGCFVT